MKWELVGENGVRGRKWELAGGMGEMWVSWRIQELAGRNGVSRTLRTQDSDIFYLTLLIHYQNYCCKYIHIS